MSDMWPQVVRGRRREQPPVRLPDGTIGQHCSNCRTDQPRNAFVPGNPTCRSCRDELAAVHEPIAEPKSVPTSKPSTINDTPWPTIPRTAPACRRCGNDLPKDAKYPWCGPCRATYVKRHPNKYGKQKKPQIVGASQNPSTGRSRQVPAR